MNKQLRILFSLVFSLSLTMTYIPIIGGSATSYAQKSESLIKSKMQNYACVLSALNEFHCDPSVQRRQGYEISASKIVPIYNVTNNDPIFVSGKQGNGLEMHAYDKEPVRFTSTNNLKLKQFSISFWVKTLDGDNFRYGDILSHADTVGKSGWFFDSKDNVGNSSQNISFNIYNSRGELFTVGPVTVQSGPFVHIVGTFNGSILKIYKDGHFYKKSKFSGNYADYPNVQMTMGMGSDCSCNMWSGIIDEFRVYNGTLTEGEVNQVFKNASGNIGTNVLIGYWPLNGNLNDVSGHNYDGIKHTQIGSMVFAPDGRLFFDEINTGKIKILNDDKVLNEPFATISDYHNSWEQGLLGLVLDPKFDQNHFVYLYYTAVDDLTGKPINRVVRFTDNNNVGTDKVVILDKIPATKLGGNAGGALAFGPDDKLYITVGDAYNDLSAQDTSTLNGKVLRLNRDGSIPQDNPYRTPMPSFTPFQGLITYFGSFTCHVLSCPTPIYNIGHRNMYGIAFDNNGFGIVTESRPNNFDEINDIQKGGNYGWPRDASEPARCSSCINSLRSYFKSITPTQAIYYNNDKIPQIKGMFLFGTYIGDIYALKVDKHTHQVIDEEEIRLPHYPQDRIASPIIGIAQSPDGSVYYGAYNIYKLDSINASREKQFIFPVEMNSTAVEIKDLKIDLHEKSMLIGIHAYNDSKSYALPSLAVKIPRTILDGIFKVNEDDNTKQQTRPQQEGALKFTIDNQTSPGYTTINIELRSGTNSNVRLFGKSTTF